jgi:Ca2+-binding RTX toxin-like protein
VGGSWPGSPNSTTNWAQANMKVDYVHAYSLSNTAMAAPATISTTSGTTTLASTLASPTTLAPTTGSTTTSTSSGATTLSPSLVSPTTLSATTGSTTTGSTVTGSTVTTSSVPGPAVTLSNAADPGNLASSFAAPMTGPGTSTTYAASQLGISGVDPSTAVTVAYDTNDALTVTNNGAWGAINDATVNSTGSGNVTVNNFVDGQISLGNGDSTVTVNNAMRGTIAVGNGNDTISVTAKSNATTNNTTTITAGDGSDQISFAGASNTTAAITAGNLGNTITVGGGASAIVKSGTGNDDFVDQSTGSLRLTGGGGNDVFEFLAGAHATITDFQSGQDSIVLHGLTSSQIHVTESKGNTFIALGSGSQVELAGASLSASQIHLTFA